MTLNCNDFSVAHSIIEDNKKCVFPLFLELTTDVTKIGPVTYDCKTID
jgi:hypothetical protein